MIKKGIAIALTGIIIGAFSCTVMEMNSKLQTYSELTELASKKIADEYTARKAERSSFETEKKDYEKLKKQEENRIKKSEEAFQKYRNENPVPKDFLKKQFLNCEYEYALEQKIKAEESKNAIEIVEESEEKKFDWSTIYGADQYQTFIFTVYSEVGGEDPTYNSEMIKAVAYAFLNNMRICERSPEEEAFKWPGAYSNCRPDHTIWCGEGAVSWDIINQKPEWLEIVSDCWNGKAESPIPEDYDCFLAPSLMGYEYLEVSVFAEDKGISEYVVVAGTTADGIFFPKMEWPENL